MSADEPPDFSTHLPQPIPADPTAVLSRHETAEWVALDGEVVVFKGQESHSYVLNPMAALMWQCLDGESSLAEILTDVAEAFEVDRAQVLDDFLPVAGFWVERGIVTTDAESSPAGDAQEGDVEPWRWLESPPNECGKAELSRWPGHIVVGIGGAAVTVASDRQDVIDRLEPWRIDVETALVDFVLELDPPRAPGHRFLRRLPNLSHGCEPLFRLRDESVLLDAFWRSIASFSTPGLGQLRVRMMPLIHDGQALLLPPEHGGAIFARAYAARSITPLYTIASVIDVDTWTVQVDPPLGELAEVSPEAARSYPIAAWWLPTEDPTAGLTPGEAVAFVLRWSSRASDDAGERLALAAKAVARQLPGLAPMPPNGFLEQVSSQLANELRDELLTAILECFEAAGAEAV